MATWYKPKDLDKIKALSDEADLKKLGFVKVSDGLWRGPYQRMGIRVKA